MQRGLPFESSAPTHNALMCEVALTFWLLKCCLISIIPPFCCDDSFDELEVQFSFNLANAAFHVRHQVRGIDPSNL